MDDFLCARCGCYRRLRNSKELNCLHCLHCLHCLQCAFWVGDLNSTPKKIFKLSNVLRFAQGQALQLAIHLHACLPLALRRELSCLLFVISVLQSVERASPNIRRNSLKIFVEICSLRSPTPSAYGISTYILLFSSYFF
jgi:hypothetical protein